MEDPAQVTVPWHVPPATDWKRWCEKSPLGTAIAPIDQSIDWWTTYETFPSSVLGSVEMLYGTAWEEGYGAWGDLKGFGIRKIATKHGWSTQDEADTMQTVLNPVTVTGPTGDYGRYEFTGESYAPSPEAPPELAATGSCHRVVVVETTKRQNEPRSRSIITSYGDWTGEKPPQN